MSGIASIFQVFNLIGGKTAVQPDLPYFGLMPQPSPYKKTRIISVIDFSKKIKEGGNI
jgi:hypothetical protein